MALFKNPIIKVSQSHTNFFGSLYMCGEVRKNNSERPVDALAENGKITDPLTAWNQEMLAHLKTVFLRLPLLTKACAKLTQWDDHLVGMRVALLALRVAPANSNRTGGEGSVSTLLCRLERWSDFWDIAIIIVVGTPIITIQYQFQIPINEENICLFCPRIVVLFQSSIFAHNSKGSNLCLGLNLGLGLIFASYITGVTIISIIFERSLTSRRPRTREDQSWSST